MPKNTPKDRRICENVSDHLGREVNSIIEAVPLFEHKEIEVSKILTVISMLYKKGLIAMRHAK